MSGEVAFFWGALGGFCGEFFTISAHRGTRTRRKAPAVWRTWWYWIITVAWVVIGGFIALMWNGDPPLAKPVAFQLGLTAPVFIQTSIKVLPDLGVGSVD